jgi:hypothetical protein
MKTVTTVKLTEEGAMTILRGALDKARSLGAPASVAVVDDGGHLIAFGRSEEAELYSVAISPGQSPQRRLDPFSLGQKESKRKRTRRSSRYRHHSRGRARLFRDHSRWLSDHGRRALRRRGGSQRRRQKRHRDCPGRHRRLRAIVKELC